MLNRFIGPDFLRGYDDWAVLNITARMASQCRIPERDFLISQNLFENFVLPDDFGFESVGEAQFRGKEIYTNLFYIYPIAN